MSLSPGPFFTCFIISIFLVIYLHIILHRTSSFFEQGTRFVILGILIIFIRMAIPVNFPFTYTIYSHKILPDIFYILLHPVYKNYTPAEFLMAIWGLGAIIQITKLIIKQVKIKIYISQFYVSNDDYSYLYEIIEEQYKKPVKIAILPHTISPCVTGILRPTLVLSNVEDYTKEEIKYICIHEIGHLKNHHLWMTLLVEIVCCIQWWNVLIYYMKKEYALFLELTNDSFLMKTETSFNSLTYANLLIKVSKNIIKAQKLPISDSLCFITKHHSSIALRISFVINDKISNNKKSHSIIHYIIITFVIVSSMIFVPEATSYRPGNTIDDGTDLNEDNAYITKNKDGYTLHLCGESTFLGEELPEEMKNIPIVN